MVYVGSTPTQGTMQRKSLQERMEMGQIPVNRIVHGSTNFFEPTHKYHNTIAMILDSTDGWDDSTGDCNEYYRHTAIFTDITVGEAYRIVNEYIGQRPIQQPCPSWEEARDAIDILSGCGNWLMVTSDVGFVDALPFESKEKAQEAFSEEQRDYDQFNHSVDLDEQGV